MRSGIRSIVMMLAVAAAGMSVGLSALPVSGQEAVAAKAALPVPAQTKPVVQIAILLDTSNSMDGLIEQAKTQLWKIVNEFAKAQRGGQRPDIQVALYHYGTPSLGKETGYIKQLVPLTDDLDKVSEELFKLRTSGGDEYCGAVIKKAAEELKWSDDKGAYKAIFIAGNEPFTQGPVNYSEACKEAVSRGIIVNTIFCGEEQEGIRTNWKDGAALADGSFVSINQNAAVVHVDAPQDKELVDLGQKINGTYVRYGAMGSAGAQNQAAQDSNVSGIAGGGGRGATAERAITKSSAAYRNGSWDLVDGVKQNQVQLKDVKEEDLPEDMRKLDAKGREDYVAQKQKEREEIQARIKTLGEEREKFLAEKRKEGGESTLDTAVVRVVRTQAQANGMTFEK